MVSQPKAVIDPEILTSPAPAKSSKPKTTLNIKGLFNPTAIPDTVERTDEIKIPVTNEPVQTEKLKALWTEYAELRKNQSGEYQILKRDFHFDYPVIRIVLTNPVEETLLENFRRDFLQFLRDRLKNSDLTIATTLREATGKKVIYTSKEKFEHLAEKNPYLHELKERLGLDWDF